MNAQAALRQGDMLVGGRLRIGQQLGQGGMGVVFRAYDQQRRCSVALKTLHRLDAAGVYQLKGEFRTLAEVRHPNLVRLHELFSDRGFWFFTMDLIEGEPLDRWMRANDAFDEVRVRTGFAQLVDALEAIHAHGKLHRDIKPSNVLVTTEGHLYVLDFGLAIDPTTGTVGQTLTDHDVAGTPDYMAPEQAAGRSASAATDFYALGVMLFEALTGKRPFVGSAGEIIAAKQRDSAPAPASSQLPDDLTALCAALLALKAEERPGVEAVRRTLGGSASVRSSSVRQHRPSAPPLVGRQLELEQLRSAYERSCDGTSVFVAVSGESGIGKTALCQSFIREISQAKVAVVLSGRCYEHENVPFKLFDPLVDELSRYLRRLRPEQAAALLPRGVFALAELFPVLARVGVVADAPSWILREPREMQRLAFQALGEMLVRIRDRQPLVICIDDVQWADADSLRLAMHLLSSRVQVPVLFVASCRDEEGASSPTLAALLAAVRGNRQIELRELRLPHLSAEETIALTRSILGTDGRTRSSAIAGESRGNPFFALELARFVRDHDSVDSTASLATLLQRRVAALPERMRSLLQRVALAGQPLAVDIALASRNGLSDLEELCEQQLLRAREGAGSKFFECYHDRIREAIVTGLSFEDRAACHRELAAALSGAGEPELLSRCLEAVGELAGAADAAEAAAKSAFSTLAFERAAALFDRAIQLGSSEPARVVRLLVPLAESLDNAGRGLEASSVFLRAAAMAPEDEGLELQRRAAELCLVSGRMPEGAELLYRVCRALDLSLPSGSKSALASILVSRIRWASHEFFAPPSDVDASPPISPRAALRLRCLRSAATGFLGYRPLQAAAIAGVYLLESSRWADPAEQVRALGFQAHMLGISDPDDPRVASLLRRMDLVVARAPRPELTGFARLIHGTVAYCREEYALARQHLQLGLPDLQKGIGINWWELDSSRLYDQMSAFYCGDYSFITRTAPSLLDEALRCGRAWTLAMLSGFTAMPAWLSTGDVDGYRERLRAARGAWREAEVPAWPDYMLLVADALLEVCVGQPERGFASFERQSDVYRRALISRAVRPGGVGYATHRATCAAAALAASSADGAARDRYVLALRESIQMLLRLGGPKSRAMAVVFAAALAVNTGQLERAVHDLQRSLSSLEAAGAQMHVAAVQRRLGRLLGGHEGSDLTERGTDYMKRQGVTSFELITDLNCPGFER